MSSDCPTGEDQSKTILFLTSRPPPVNCGKMNGTITTTSCTGPACTCFNYCIAGRPAVPVSSNKTFVSESVQF